MKLLCKFNKKTIPILMKYFFYLIGIFLLTSCNNSKNSQEFINSTKGKYLFNSNETLEVYFIDNILKNESISKNIYTQLAENIIFLLLLIFLIFIPMKIKPKFSIIFFVGSIFVINLSSIIVYQFNFYIDFLFSSIAGTLAFMTSLYFRYLEENSIAIENDKKQSILKKEREIAGEVQKKLFPKNKKIELLKKSKDTELYRNVLEKFSDASLIDVSLKNEENNK